MLSFTLKNTAKQKTALKEKKLQMDSNDRDISYLKSVSVYIDNAASNDETSKCKKNYRRKEDWKTLK